MVCAETVCRGLYGTRCSRRQVENRANGQRGEGYVWCMVDRREGVCVCVCVCEELNLMMLTTRRSERKQVSQCDLRSRQTDASHGDGLQGAACRVLVTILDSSKEGLCGLMRANQLCTRAEWCDDRGGWEGHASWTG